MIYQSIGLYIEIPETKLNQTEKELEAQGLQATETDDYFYLRPPGILHLKISVASLEEILSVKTPGTVFRIKAAFKAQTDCMEKLQEKGFMAYEKNDYITFHDHKNDAILEVIKGQNRYELTIKAHNPNRSYMVRLMRRITKIIH